MVEVLRKGYDQQKYRIQLNARKQPDARSGLRLQFTWQFAAPSPVFGHLSFRSLDVPLANCDATVPSRRTNVVDRHHGKANIMLGAPTVTDPA